ncbi:MAG: excinuclease ABC subunit UvrA [Candidatus Scalindua rubra]|uniref:UvrABC system protein A n=1 Tax=Candidatus Scalindua brodae TaxID=237368 RepID=A0A0B0EQ14_9BACT|nr:MAG: excinuclease ABC subunit A [Candidatus Scalindua brodae]MBZ0108007.1 excinuclease ABC subunit UvrA [Candidatus Scalindua rubra]TWU28764.1 UvrABC system protein A [Candidatus Brocadiaceae bacterium S225]
MKDYISDSYISIKGARQHNLKNININIPRDQLVVITGVSGSGKSSLAFDTIYAEGQRRYIESLSSYARQFLDQMQKPDVDIIEGIPPTIAIEQRTSHTGPRSTVATTTDIYDYLRLLFAKVGTPYCHNCGTLITRQTIEQIMHRVSRIPKGTRIMILSPIIKGKKGEHKEIFQKIRRKGFIRARVDGNVIDAGAEIKLSRYKLHDIDIVVDRLVVKDDIQKRLSDSIHTSLELGEGVVIIAREKKGKWVDMVFSERYSCPDCGTGYEELAPRMFSFNSPYGSCRGCEGLGMTLEFDPELIIPNEELSLSEDAVDAWSKWSSITQEHYNNLLNGFSERFDIDTNVPFKKISKKTRNILLHGEPLNANTDERFEGIIPALWQVYDKTNSPDVIKRLEKYMDYTTCEECKGARLRPEALSVKVNGKTITEITSMTVENAFEFFKSLKFKGEKEIIAKGILKEIITRSGFMLDIGLYYLTLDRRSDTLSGGEVQRIQLATQVGTGLIGACYVLDEPTIGLHQRDNKKLIDTLKKLKDSGNTVIVVEHDEETIRNADYVIDLGPGAGEHGGEVVASGSVQEITTNKESLTSQYLNHKLKVAIPGVRKKADMKNAILIKGARENNLKSIDVRIPLNVFCCITGVSGSGKSTLIDRILHRALMKSIYGSRLKPGSHGRITGIEKIDKVIEIDQSPIGRTPRSNPATYTDLFSHIRNVFAQTKESKIRGYKSGRYSFNVKEGRCELCEGQGTKKIAMNFLPDTFVLCEQCRGKRYNPETLEIRYKGKTISDTLDMSVDEAYDFFKNIPRIERILRTLRNVGLGYITLGQSSTTISGGEAQRVKLSTELAKQSTGRTLYILDEPTTGLHFADIQKLLKILHRLTDMGNTVIVIEHNLDVIKTADYIIDMGPEGGERGGEVIASGPPEKIAGTKGSYTGNYLRSIL